MGFVRCLDDTNTEKGTTVKEMIKKVREDRSGFTLAELLIVVAIIAVLVAVAIPVFTNASTEAQTATAQADLRSVQASASTQVLLDKVEVPDAGIYYTATVDRSGNLTNLKQEGSAATTQEEVVEWLKGSDATFSITVLVQDVEAGTGGTTTP